MEETNSATATPSSGGTASKLDLQLADDGGHGEEHPRRLLRIGRHLVAYGGENNRLVEIIPASDGGSGSAVRRIEHHEEDCEGEAIRAVAVSHDGKRVAIGLDTGSTLVYAYDSDDDKALLQGEHPFVVSSPSNRKVLVGPPLEGGIRDLQFYPDSYLLAVATEGSGFCIANVTSKDTILMARRYLQEEGERAHDRSGIRGLAFGSFSGRKSGAANTTILATLAMDGRLCLWDCSLKEDPASWRLLKREDARCITKKDVGEILGADAFDRSCRPHWMVTRRLMALPGECYLQLRTFDDKNNGDIHIKQWDFASSDESAQTAEDGSIKGHIQSIVALTSHPNEQEHPYLISSGRDGRLIVWNVVKSFKSNKVSLRERGDTW